MNLHAEFTTNPAIAAWVADRIPPTPPDGFGEHIALAVWDGDEPVAGLIYHNWFRDCGTVELSGAAKPGRYWMTRPILNKIFEYPFRTSQMMFMRHRLDNPIRKMWLRFGGEEVIVRRMYGPNADGAIHTFTREEWWAHPIRAEQPELF